MPARSPLDHLKAWQQNRLCKQRLSPTRHPLRALSAEHKCHTYHITSHANPAPAPASVRSLAARNRNMHFDVTAGSQFHTTRCSCTSKRCLVMLYFCVYLLSAPHGIVIFNLPPFPQLHGHGAAWYSSFPNAWLARLHNPLLAALCLTRSRGYLGKAWLKIVLCSIP